MSRYEICLCGIGGQGLILAGSILAEAVAIHGGKQVTMSQEYGPNPRGGISTAELVISEENIDYPKITKPNLIVALSQEAYNHFKPLISSEGIILVDSELVNIDKNDAKIEKKLLRLPMNNAAFSVFHNGIYLNMICLGAILSITHIVGEDELKKAIIEKSPSKFAEQNIRAFEHGLHMTKNLRL